MDKYRIDELFVGQYCEKEFLINEEMGVEFAKISQDFNPIHLDYEEVIIPVEKCTLSDNSEHPFPIDESRCFRSPVQPL